MKLIKWQFNLSALKNPKFIWGSSALLGGIAYIKVWVPLTNLSIPCPFYSVTGHFCPGCGITRAVSALLRGEFKLAWQYNSLLFIVPIIFLVYYTLLKSKYRKYSEPLLYITIAFVILFGLLRNFPMFSFLAPPNI